VKTEKVFIVSRRVIDAAEELFLSRGFVRVTADDIAAEVGISKATLYQAFRGKDEILRAVVRRFLAETGAEVDGLIKEKRLGFAERLARLFALIGERLGRFGPLVVRDMQKAAPDIWREIEEFRREKLLSNFKGILAAGRDQGMLRDDLDLDLLLDMFLRLVESYINPAEYRRTGRAPAETFASVIRVFFQGILTERGRRDLPALFEPLKEGGS